MTTVAGDRDEAWRRTYLRVRKDPLVAADRTNRRRLSAMGVANRTTGTWLDLGAGDGNVAASLAEMGADPVIAVEYQSELLRYCTARTVAVVGEAAHVPLRDRSVDTALAMDVLHHLELRMLDDCLRELHRVIRPGGRLLVCEPAPTVVRRLLQVVLMSPLSKLTGFSRDKRTMVELEAGTLVPWLAAESEFVRRAAAHGFQLERTARRPLHTLRSFRTEDHPRRRVTRS